MVTVRVGNLLLSLYHVRRMCYLQTEKFKTLSCDSKVADFLDDNQQVFTNYILAVVSLSELTTPVDFTVTGKTVRCRS